MSITLNNVKYSYDSGFFLDIDIEIPENSWVVVVGKSGAGKTTLLKLLSGILTPDSGEIQFKQDNAEIGFIFQNPDDQIIQLSLEKELAFNLENKAMSVQQMAEKIERTLVEYNFDGRAKESPNNLSGGEKQRLALAATLISDPSIMIFDEPSSFLDYKQKEKLYSQVQELKKLGKTIIWTSHEIDEFLLADEIIEIEEGKITYSGNSHDYLKQLFKHQFIENYINEN